MFGKIAGFLTANGVRIDTIPSSTIVEVGGTLDGHVQIIGSEKDVAVHELALDLNIGCMIESGDEKRYGSFVCASLKLPLDMIPAGSDRLIPFGLPVPLSAPVSAGQCKAWLSTRLDMPMAIDPRDEDTIRIVPNGLMRRAISAVESLGFRLGEVETEYHARRTYPLVQEFDFRPAGWRGGRIEEVELSFSPKGKKTNLRLTVDRKAGLIRPGRERVTNLVFSADAEESEIRKALQIAISALA
jgi:sporulation-control protein